MEYSRNIGSMGMKLPCATNVLANVPRILRLLILSQIWGYLVSISLGEPYHLRVSDMNFPKMSMETANQQRSQSWLVYNKTGMDVIATVNEKASLKLPASPYPQPRPVNGLRHYDFLLFAPILSNGWVILGELDKVTSFSSSRFHSLNLNNAGLTANLRGARHETTTVSFFPPFSDVDQLPAMGQVNCTFLHPQLEVTLICTKRNCTCQ